MRPAAPPTYATHDVPLVNHTPSSALLSSSSELRCPQRLHGPYQGFDYLSSSARSSLMSRKTLALQQSSCRDDGTGAHMARTFQVALCPHYHDSGDLGGGNHFRGCSCSSRFWPARRARRSGV